MSLNTGCKPGALKNVLVILILVIMTVLAVTVGCDTSTKTSPLPTQARLRVATTTSLYDTGLWGYLEPMFEEKYNVELDVIYAGTGKALEYGRRGDVDIITVHSREREEEFILAGHGVERVPFAYNYFLIVGPENDPAGIKGLSPVDAFQKLMTSGSDGFISRGDDSGTHGKEKSIWQEAGYDYEAVRKAGPWYLEAGSGMGPILRMASEKQAYTLTDVGTFLAYRSNLELELIINKDSMLLNVYSAIVVNPQNVAGVNIDMAQNMIDFLTSVEVQKLIGSYGVESFGRPLFIPCAGKEPK
jgi:tungstate transport system substrate-binding protein